MPETEIEATETPETTEQAPAVEAAVPAATPDPGVLGANLKVLMDRESALRQRTSQMKDLEGVQAEYRRVIDLAKTEPVRFLESQGHTMDKLAEMATTASDPAAAMRQELDALKSKIEAQDKVSEDTLRSQKIDDARDGVETWINSSEKFPFVKTANAGGLVFQKMLDHYNATGEEKSEEQAAREVEADIQILAKKLSPLLTAEDSTEGETPPEATPPTTLTNQQAAVRPPANAGATRNDALAEAASLLRFV